MILSQCIGIPIVLSIFAVKNNMYCQLLFCYNVKNINEEKVYENRVIIE